jgi:hypothetical protein
MRGVVMPKITVSEFKRALAAAAKVDARRPDPLGAAESPRLLSKRLAMEERLAAQFTKAGLDIRSFDRARQKYSRELRRVADKAQSDAAKRSSKVGETLRLAAESRFEAVKYIGAGPNLPAFPIVTTLDRPFLIWATWTPIPQHSNIIWDSAIEAGHSWAKIKVVDEGSGGNDRLIFYYLWENESDYQAVINVSTYLALHGFCRARGNGSFSAWLNNYTEAMLDITASLTLKEWSNQPRTLTPYFPPDSDAHKRVSFLSVGSNFSEETKTETVVDGYNLKWDLVVIPPRGVVVIEVSVAVFHSVRNGHVLADFASEYYRITSPYVQVGLLSAPGLARTPTVPAGMYG